MSTVLLRTFILLATLVGAAGIAFAQSSDPLFPTPVRSTEIVSSISPRDLGDSRLTSYYYTFEGDQGDIFVNVQSKNFTGDIDIFLIPTQTPLTKIVVYADQVETETGRVIYLRKPERLLLRIQGRTPGDDEASIRIKFAGSFAVSKLDDTTAPGVPKVDPSFDTDVKVNSAGTILAVTPKIQSPKETVAETEHRSVVEKAPATAAGGDLSEKSTVAREPELPPADAVNEAQQKPVESATLGNDRADRTAASTNSPVRKSVEKKPRPSVARSRRTASDRKELPAEESFRNVAKVDPMANIRLVIYFKNGSTIERPMPEVQRFSIERAILTVINKNGTIGRYDMAEVLRVSIE